MKIDEAYNHRHDIVRLLEATKLPTADLPEQLANFYVALQNEQLAGVVGVEQYGNHGLLRSLAVQPEYRKQGIAGKLLNKAMAIAKDKGLDNLYLLTETASDYFTRQGFAIISRDDVPNEVKKSSEFSHVCPQSAIVMYKSLK